MFILDSKDGRPLYIKLYNQIKNQILSGNLLPHTKLPSIRQLSAEIAVSRNTVEYVYEQLCTEGFIHSKPRSGYYVSSLEPEFIPRPSRNTVASAEQHSAAGKTYAFDFHPAGLSPDSFPGGVWHKLLSDCLKGNAEQFSAYSNPQGEIELRCEIQRYLERFRGVSCDPEQIVVCCGLQDSLAIVAQMLRGDHSVLAVEDPGYWVPRSIFRNHSFAITAVPVNSDGLDLDYLKNTDSAIIYVTPSHQFPLGYVMPVENRLKLINWAETTGAVIIEDDYDSELRYQGKPIPALQGLHPLGNIIYVGTFSKVLSPALRVSYMVLPRPFLTRYRKLFSNYFATVSLLEQRALCKFMEQGYWERHLRKMRTIYKKKHDALLQAIDRQFGSRVTILGQGAGLHVVLELVENSLDEEELISRAQEQKVRLIPLSNAYLCTNDYHSKIMLGFGGMNPPEIDQGVKLLCQAWYPE